MRFFQWLFGGGRNVIAETAEVFRENAEAGAQRKADYAEAALSQYAAEFRHARRGGFDRFMDGLNRLPRPLMVVATFLLFASAMFDPIWFATRMQGLALVPEPLWWLAGTIVAFYFGGRFQIKSQEFQQSVVQSAAMVPKVIENIRRLDKLRHDTPGVADTGTDSELAQDAISPQRNQAIEAWKGE
ncbi:holin family protein [Cognatishimia sp. MH4019]|uniref:holin family protein n=1 Tax=Cognatishimia sp. MH4019 TaxID=2854030 RepID=UPI001CD37C78|nr:holin family protein [Cognatishimia sp. MH4019]